MIYNINDAKAHFYELIEQALKGEDVIIAKNDKPVVRLVIHTKANKKRRGGQLRGLIKIEGDFNTPLPVDLLAQFLK